jgi:hypothetical protein
MVAYRPLGKDSQSSYSVLLMINGRSHHGAIAAYHGPFAARSPQSTISASLAPGAHLHVTPIVHPIPQPLLHGESIPTLLSPQELLQ